MYEGGVTRCHAALESQVRGLGGWDQDPGHAGLVA